MVSSLWNFLLPDSLFQLNLRADRTLNLSFLRQILNVVHPGHDFNHFFAMQLYNLCGVISGSNG